MSRTLPPMSRTLPIAHVLGGGTFFHVRPHLALAAPAYGTLARYIASYLGGEIPGRHDGKEFDVRLKLTKMADRNSTIETNADVARYIDEDVLGEPRSRLFFLTAALADWEGSVLDDMTAYPKYTASGKDQPRLRTDVPTPGSQFTKKMLLKPAEKVLLRVRSREAKAPRKDIFLVACKTTAGATDEEMYARAVEMMKRGSVNLVLANDVQRRRSMIVTPEQTSYSVSDDRRQVVRDLVDMAVDRSRATFIRTEVREGNLAPWISTPDTFREVVNFAVAKGAYRPNALGVTVGHFAHRTSTPRGSMWSSRRRKNFNQVEDRDLVCVETTPDGRVLAWGGLPSAGARSQMILFENHPEFDSVIHFHCPLRPGHDPDLVIRSQREFECGSNECGRNTSAGIRVFDVDGAKIGAVMLDKHGPNVLFRSNDDSEKVIRFIDRNFDLTRQTSELSPADQITSLLGTRYEVA